MKKVAVWIVAAGLIAGDAGLVMAAQRGTAEYQQMVELKKKQREEKKVRKADPSPNAKGFWAREAERSGFAGTGAMFANAIPLPKSNKDDK